MLPSCMHFGTNNKKNIFFFKFMLILQDLLHEKCTHARFVKENFVCKSSVDMNKIQSFK